jgi:hypothetical protein
MSVISIGIGVVIAGILITIMSIAGLEIFLQSEITDIVDQSKKLPHSHLVLYTRP